MSLTFVTLAERPDLVDAMWAMPNPWPEFMRHDPVSHELFGRLPAELPDYQLVALDEHGTIVGKLHSVPFACTGRNDDLPAHGLDAIIQRAFAERARGVEPAAVSLLEDPWLRVHARLGARIVKVCPLSMLVPGTLAQWRAWTGLELATSGLHDVPDALAPIHVSVEHDYALYAEANVWMHHALAPSVAEAGLPDSAS